MADSVAPAVVLAARDVVAAMLADHVVVAAAVDVVLASAAAEVVDAALVEAASVVP